MVERYYGPLIGYEMKSGERGDFVRYCDYADLERQIAELRAEVDRIRYERGLYCLAKQTAEAENARLRALPLKDEVERVVKLLSCLDLDHSTEHDDLILETCVKDARYLLPRLRAGEQEGWRLVPGKPTEQIVTAISRFVRERAIPVADDDDPDAVYFDYGHARALYHAILVAAPSEQGGDRS